MIAKTKLIIHNSKFIIFLLLLAGCSSNSPQQAITFESPVWSPDGAQVAYFRRALTTQFQREEQVLLITADSWNLCVNNAAGDAERIIVPYTAMYHPSPDNGKYETLVTNFALTWPTSDTLRYYVYGKSLIDSAQPALTDGVHKVGLDGKGDKVIDAGANITATLGLFDARRRSFGGLTLYGQSDSPAAGRTIMIADDRAKTVRLYLQDPTAGKVSIPGYDQLTKEQVDVPNSP